ncbi:MAG: UDP-N-acetylmuramoyl-L-alanyl-D-glutamate--2,6-diaminopimelate ligase [Candidatus Omnitrophica bacterium]|nr:UDP-N-acetylmuramoyl-L-alanyl-D-glutamate--2,6-diaminopimelate ligase [Candidatus Omnitrophota bacterium]
MNNPLENISFTSDNIKTDSRQVNPGDVFFAIKGTLHDGHDFVAEAVKKGAAFAICEHEIPGLPEEGRRKVVLTGDAKEALGSAAKDVFNDPADALSVYGVTGTNGKTTTVFLIDSILTKAGNPSGLISTVFTKLREGEVRPSSMTTPDLVTMYRLLSEIRSNGNTSAVIEVSSHALSQGRVRGIGLDSAVFTNLTPEHLDYHGDMDSYLRDKARIFLNLKPDGLAVLNVDDPLVIGLKKSETLPEVVTFGVKGQADVTAKNVELTSGGAEFDLAIKDLGDVTVRTSLIGEHNVSNILAAVAALSKRGLSLEDMRKGIENASPPPGRLDEVERGAPFKVFVDYAHTPNALENVLASVRPLASGRLICVFGCGGDRDKTKRPLMGKIAASLCDNVIVTSDNPRTEDPLEILKEIEKGMLDSKNYSIIEQRHVAIREALESAEAGDVVIITGKGHEAYQIVGDQVLPFDDKEVARGVLAELGY